MRKTDFLSSLSGVLLWTCALPLCAATFTGTVTNKTTNKPSQGDTVTLVNVQAGMSDAESTTTDGAGRYSLTAAGMGPYLIRVTHQGAPYFIAAPQNGGGGDVAVYDVAAKVDGVGIDADMLLIEAGGGTLRVKERYLVRNTSLPPRVQFSDKTFEIVLPADAEVDGASATRPGGLGTNTRLAPLGGNGHYAFNIPIQPDKGEKETMFEVQYHIPYTGSYTFTSKVQMRADHLVVYLAPGMKFSKSEGASFQSAQQDPRVQTYVARGVEPGQSVHFTVSGEGQMEQVAQGEGMGASAGMGSQANGTPGGGIGAPIDTPDPLTRYKWWILSLLALLLVGGSVFLLRRQGGITAKTSQDATETIDELPVRVERAVQQSAAPRTSKGSEPAQNLLMNRIKEEMFAIESERLTGTLSPNEYAEIKSGLDALLKRVLKERS